MSKTQCLLLAVAAAAMGFTVSCSSEGSLEDGGGNTQGGSGSVTYEGQKYKTVKIGTQTWMAENLNYAIDGSVCHDNDPANCTKYGRLYDWATAMNFPSSCNSSRCAEQIQSPHQGICPRDWHLPTQADWDTLSSYVESNYFESNSDCTDCRAATLLKAKTGWNTGSGYIAGMDYYGFSALPGGYGRSDGTFRDVGDFGIWWSAREDNVSNSYYQSMNYDSKYTGWSRDYKSLLHSVRCIKD